MPSFRVANGQEVPLDLVGVYKGWNGQLYDLGLPHYQMTNRTAVLRKISELDGELDFVLIMERFEESLVLLADELCIPLHELTFISKLVRVSQSKVREGLNFPRYIENVLSNLFLNQTLGALATSVK